MQPFRKYGNPPFNLVVVHGGPGVPGELAPLARKLSRTDGVLEPFQTKNSISGQVRELKTFIENNSNAPITLIGYSWGAWLSFILTSKYPSLVKKLILISSGSFDEKYAKSTMDTRLERLTENERSNFKKLLQSLENPKTKNKNSLMKKIGNLMSRTDGYAPIKSLDECVDYQYSLHRKLWNQARTLRSSGKLLKYGEKIICPVIAIHGDYDPHSAKGVRIPLESILPDFKFILLKKCGHTPWLEKYAKDEFYFILKNLQHI